MRRIVIALGTTLTGLVLLFSYSTSLNRSAFAAPGRVAAQPPPSTASSGAGSGAAAGPAPTTFDGATVDTRYGPVQVRITVAAGKVTVVDTLQLPHGNSYDEQVDQFAVPLLAQEAVAAQSAQIDAVSGATFTSDGYRQSLQSALDKAQL